MVALARRASRRGHGLQPRASSRRRRWAAHPGGRTGLGARARGEAPTLPAGRLSVAVLPRHPGAGGDPDALLGRCGPRVRRRLRGRTGFGSSTARAGGGRTRAVQSECRQHHGTATCAADADGRRPHSQDALGLVPARRRPRRLPGIAAAEWLAGEGREEEALDLYMRAAQSREPRGPGEGGRVAQCSRKCDRALAFLQYAADLGVDHAASRRAYLLFESGQVEQGLDSSRIRLALR